MSVTLNLSHTFTTRVVYSTEQVAEVREELARNIKEGREYVERITVAKKKAAAKAGLKLLEMALSMDDDGLILFLTREAFKNGIKETLQNEVKDLNVTRTGPLQTTLVSSKKPEACTCDGVTTACSKCPAPLGPRWTTTV